MSFLGSKKIIQTSFGQSFEKRTYKRDDPFAVANQSHRWVFLVLLLIIFFLVGIGRLIELQIIFGDYYRGLAEGNRIRRIPVKAPRGEIFDRNDRVLVRNVPIYKLATFTMGGVVESIQTISREQAIKIQTENKEESARLLIDVGREYPEGSLTAHVLGFVNEVSDSEVSQFPDCDGKLETSNYKFEIGDSIGRLGVEHYYDCHLRGINGEELIEVDAHGRLVRRLGRREPVPGKALKLALDLELQKKSYDELQNALDEKGLVPRQDNGEIVKGAVVAQDPNNGEILALVSLPSFNPMNFQEKYASYANDENLPFFNRAMGGAYHPGSTFKLAVAIAGLESGAISEDYKYEDLGFIEAGGTRFRNWFFTRNGGKEGEINIVRAIARSTDTFFYILGEKVGIDEISRWAIKLGLGKLTGIDLPFESAGVIPTQSWKLEKKGERWYLGDTYNSSIGQGDVSSTPVQINQLTGLVANGGKRCVPKIKLGGDDTCANIGLSNNSLRLVKEGMLGACSVGGTSGQFLSFPYKVACKTGTAETGVGKSTHAWFTAFMPADNSKLVITVLVENGGEGSVVSAPIVRRIAEYYVQ